VSVGRLVAVGVSVGTVVAVGVSVGTVVGVGVFVGTVVAVGVSVGTSVPVGVAVTVGVGVAVSVGVAVAVGVDVAGPSASPDASAKLLITRSSVGAVSAANTVKCDVLPVIVLPLTLEPPSTGCQVEVAGSKKNTPDGVLPVKASVTCTGCANVAPLAPLAVRSTAVLTTC
jgi:hypothetical protein